MAARFPDKPTSEESEAAKSFMFLFSRLYPCGDCARHFQMFMEKYPPQVSSRSAFAGWLCMAHNKANTALNKPQFDCTKIGDFYDCGCGEDDKDKKVDKEAGELKEKSA
jgi:FAD-linked sulfhydryl oxidase